MKSESQFSTFNMLTCTYINMVYNFMYQWVAIGKQIERGGGTLIRNGEQAMARSNFAQKIRGG